MKKVNILSRYENKNNDMPEKWLDNQDVIELMKISKRTLQRWREKKHVPYAKIGRKCYYRHSDLMAMLDRKSCSPE